MYPIAETRVQTLLPYVLHDSLSSYALEGL